MAAHRLVADDVLDVAGQQVAVVRQTVGEVTVVEDVGRVLTVGEVDAWKVWSSSQYFRIASSMWGNELAVRHVVTGVAPAGVVIADSSGSSSSVQVGHRHVRRWWTRYHPA